MRHQRAAVGNFLCGSMTGVRSTGLHHGSQRWLRRGLKPGCHAGGTKGGESPGVKLGG